VNNTPAAVQSNENLRLEDAAAAQSNPQLPSKIAIHSPISNRHSRRLEMAATHSKQTTAPISNRHFQRGCSAQNPRRIPSQKP
jgi:hypothetical protein